ncbi:Fic family protein [Oerskovia sp. Sa1BUA8]|uniref:protein adenylyltransferase n=1 Tax=Oerskovia douganii TaxID=2762210 RepID=A0A9D5YZ12_9CELL|nr:Fic family protein [Oerskovia douganii]MBE7700046.1 Fic family protein [Oerskovia douganii]
MRNLLGKTEQSELDTVEYDFTFARREEFELVPITGPFDFERLKETHRRLFQDVYDWAGQVRTVEISKNGSAFHHARYIPTAAEDTFGWLHRTRLLDPKVDDETFVVDAARVGVRIDEPLRPGHRALARSSRSAMVSLPST